LSVEAQSGAAAGDARRLTLVMNPTAAGGRPLRVLPGVQEQLRALGLEHRVVQTTDIEHAAAEARAAAEGGETVVALGGDGLVGAIAAAVRSTGPIGVLPGGRGNDFARALGISQDPNEACRVLADGEERRVDLGEVNGRPFVSIASAGFDSDANRIANEVKLIKGNLVYLYGALRALAAWKDTNFTVELDGEKHEFQGYNVITANSAYYGGGMRVAPDADMADGIVDVVLIGSHSKLRFLSNLPKVFSGKHVAVEGVSAHRAREVRISADRPFDVYADGDRLTELPATVRMIPGELRVIAPR
jgi:YegS/Rv2252/BmrU family lipid kinase